MQPFDEASRGQSGPQMAFDARRLRYLESLTKGAFLKGERFAAWNESERRRQNSNRRMP